MHDSEGRKQMKKTQTNQPKTAAKQTAAQEYIHYHKDGTIWARGQNLNGTATGDWEWFRKDGTRLRSGHFERGRQVGEWITYDQTGKVYKVTKMRSNTKKGG